MRNIFRGIFRRTAPAEYAGRHVNRNTWDESATAVWAAIYTPRHAAGGAR